MFRCDGTGDPHSTPVVPSLKRVYARLRRAMARAGTHKHRPVVMGPRFRGDDTREPLSDRARLMNIAESKFLSTDLLARFAAIVGEKYAITDAQAQAPYLVEFRDLYRGHTPVV